MLSLRDILTCANFGPSQLEQESIEKLIPKPDHSISDASFQNLNTQPGQNLIIKGDKAKGLAVGQEAYFQIGDTWSAVELLVEAGDEDSGFSVRHKDPSHPVYVQLQTGGIE